MARKGRMRAELPELPGNGLPRESPPSSVTCGDSFPRGGSLLAQQKTHTQKISACAFFVLLYFSHRPAEQVGGGAVMGDEDRGALPRQPFCGGDGVLDKLGIHAGEGLVQQERFRIAAEQRAQQSGTALLPAGEPRRRQRQLGIRKAKGTQLTLGILRRQAVAGQRQVGGGSQLRAEAILLKDGGGRFDAGHCAGVRGLQSQQDAQQRGLAAAGAAHQHHGAVHRPGKVLQNRRTAEAFAEIGYHNAHTRTSPQRRVLAVRSRAAAAADSAADSSTMTSVHANTSGVDRVIFAR